MGVVVTCRKVFLVSLGPISPSLGELTPHSTNRGRVPPIQSRGLCPAVQRETQEPRPVLVFCDVDIGQSSFFCFGVGNCCALSDRKALLPPRIGSPRATGGPGFQHCAHVTRHSAQLILPLSGLAVVTSQMPQRHVCVGLHYFMTCFINIMGLGGRPSMCNCTHSRKAWPWEELKGLAWIPGVQC